MTMEPEMMRDNFKVDKNKLDEEWEQQPITGFDYGKDHAAACKDRDHAKRLMDLALAEAMDFVLNNYEDHGLNRQQSTSSTFVRNVAVQTKDYQEKYKDFIEKEHEVNVLQSASYAMLAKRASMEYLTKLYLADYFTTDTQIPESRRETIQEKEAREMHGKVLEENPRLKRRKRDRNTGNNS